MGIGMGLGFPPIIELPVDGEGKGLLPPIPRAPPGMGIGMGLPPIMPAMPAGSGIGVFGWG